MKVRGKSLALIVVVAACSGPWTNVGLDWDSCLDQGGQWDSVRHACRTGNDGSTGRLVLRDFAARQLGLQQRVLRQVDSLGVPPAVRIQANRLRHDVSGDSTHAVRYYAESDAWFVALVPSFSFESQDPHVIVVFRPDGSPLTSLALATYAAVEVYCPAEGPLHPEAGQRDSTDGCRYFYGVEPSPPKP